MYNTDLLKGQWAVSTGNVRRSMLTHSYYQKMNLTIHFLAGKHSENYISYKIHIFNFSGQKKAEKFPWEENFLQWNSFQRSMNL